MKAIILSCTPAECEKIVNGDMSILVRKKAPKEVPFKAYIYETKGATETPWVDEDGHFIYKGRGQVIGSFICDKVEKFDVPYPAWNKAYLNDIFRNSCLTYTDLHSYIGSGNSGYGWHISDLKIYDKPKALSCFYKQCPKNTTCSTCDWLHVDWHTFGECSNTVTHPPKNYIYVEE